MRKVTSSILIGLACTSILSLSAGVPPVKADAPEAIKQSQDIGGNFQNFLYLDVPTVDQITSLTTVVTGTGEPGAIVTLHMASSDISYKGVVDIQGKYRITLDRRFEVGEKYEVSQEKNGESSGVTSIWLYVSAPDHLDAPTVNKVTSTDRVVTGTGTPGTTIHFAIGSQDYTGEVDDSGNYSVTLDQTYFAGTSFVAYLEKDGTESDAVGGVVEEALVLAVPTLNPVTTNDKAVTGTGIAGATIHLTIAGKDYSGTVNSDGTYSIALDQTYPVGSSITLYQEKDGDKSENVSGAVVEVTHLEVPTLNPVSALDQTVTGTGVPGAIIHLTINGESHLGEVGEDGKFSILTNKAYPAGSAITIYQEKNGVTSDSVTATVVAPEQLDVPKLNVVSDKDTKVTGTAAAGATVHLSINGLNFHTVASATGEFSINIEKNYPANTPIEVYQELNGVKSNTTEVYVQLTANFVINKIKSNAASITGTGHPNAQITVQIDDEDFTGTVDGSGNFTINLQGATFKVGTDVTLTSVSAEGTETKTVQIYPQDPVISTVYAEDRDIRGTTDPGATVIITVGAEQYQTTADSDGNFRQSVDPNVVISGALVTVYSNIDGYKSDEVTKTVI